MKKLLLLFVLSVAFISRSQVILQYDNMETFSPAYSTAGWWTPAVTAGWYTNASVSPTTSAVIYGSGTGTSAVEQDWYSLPNVILNPANQYQLKFRLASYTFTNSTASTRGNDAGDYISVQVSTNGGVTYVNELRITGNSNATWPYTSTGSIFHTANGTFTNSAAPTGDIYQAPAGATTTGPSTIYLNLPLGISQVAIDILCRVNSAGEEWWLDNIELWDITPISLPIELTSFDGVNKGASNFLYWTTASEYNNSYFTLERSIEGEQWRVIASVAGAINSTHELFYTYSDTEFERGVINYYRLSQTDLDGKSESFDIISINNITPEPKLLKTINLAGQEVGEGYKGFVIEIYEGGKIIKKLR